MTFPRSVGQIPIYYNAKNTGRPFDPDLKQDKYKSKYIDSPNTPLYPFGYGLSYTSYSYSEVSLNKSSFARGEEIVASVDVTNSGSVDGEEIVQLYVRDRVGDVTRPVKELKGFQKVRIKKGETVTVTFTIRPGDLNYYHEDMSYTYDAGEFELFISPDSADERYVMFSIL